MKTQLKLDGRIRNLLTLIAFFFCTGSFSQVTNYYSEVEKDDIKMMTIENFDSLNSVKWRKDNKLSECKIEQFDYKDDNSSKESKDEISYKFDSEGRIIERIYKNNKFTKKYEYLGKFLNKTTVINNDNKKVVQECNYEYDLNGKLLRETIQKDRLLVPLITVKALPPYLITYSYNENNLISETMIFAKDGKYEFFRERISYNEKNQEIERQTCQRGYKQMSDLSNTFADIDCSNKIEYFYDSIGNIVQSNIYYPVWVPVVGMVRTKNPQNKYIYVYNEMNMITKESTYDTSDGTLKQETLYNYDISGDPTEIIINDAYGTLVSRTAQSFDNKKLTMKMKSSADGTIDYMYSYIYDKNGTRIQINEHDPYAKKIKQAFIAVLSY